MDYFFISTGVVGSWVPRSSVSGETLVLSASEAGFVAFSDLCVAPEVCYQIPHLATVKPSGVSVCDAAAARSVCTGYPQTKKKNAAFYVKERKIHTADCSPQLVLERASPDGEALVQTPLVCVSASVSQGDAKQSGQRHLSRATSPPLWRCDPIPGLPGIVLGPSWLRNWM